MKNKNRLFCSLAYLMQNSCAMAAAFSIFSFVEEMPNTSPALPLWLLCLALCCVSLQFFMRRERSERQLMIFCGVFFAVQTVLVFVVYGFFSSFVGVLAAVAMWLFSYLSCYELCISEINTEKLSKSFDICSVLLAFMLFFCQVKEFSAVLVLPLAVSVFCGLLALVLVKATEQRRAKSLALSGGLVLVFGAVSLVFAALASGGIKSIMIMLGNAVKWLFAAFMKALDRLMRFLLELLPQRQYEMAAPEEIISPLAGGAEEIPQFFEPELVISAIICVVIAAAACYVLYRIISGKGFTVKVKAGSGQGISRRSVGFVPALKKALTTLISRLHFFIKRISSRNTAAGLFVQIESRSRAKLHGRGESESCREFLLRALNVYPHARTEIERLADSIDAACFGSGGEISSAEIVKMRRVIFSPEN